MSTTSFPSTLRAQPPLGMLAIRLLSALVLLPMVLLALYTAITLWYTYSAGERSGFLQKLSHKGWVCKTWEGEMLMVSQPGVVPEKFYFSVRDDAVVKQIEASMGQRVTLVYEQKKGIPTSCFGETEYFVTGIQTRPQ